MLIVSVVLVPLGSASSTVRVISSFHVLPTIPRGLEVQTLKALPHVGCLGIANEDYCSSRIPYVEGYIHSALLALSFEL